MDTTTRTDTRPGTATSAARTDVTGSASISDKDVIALERAYWDALETRDANTLRRLMDEQSTIVGRTGVNGYSPEAIGDSIENGEYRVQAYLFNDESVRINRICDDVVSIAYAVHQDLEIDGTATEVDTFDTAVWKRSDLGWTCILRTEAITGDPYGRDQTPMEPAED